MLIAPLQLKLALPVLIILCTAWICHRFTWLRHPGLISLFVGTSATYLLALAWYDGYCWGILAGLVCATVAVLEVLTFSRLRPSSSAAVIAATVGLCALLAFLPLGLTAIQRVNLFRQYCYIVLAGVSCWAMVYRWKRPLSAVCVDIRRVRQSYPECFRHKAYRVGLAAWMLSYAISGMFVAGGIGFAIFPYTQRTFYAVELANIVILLLVVGAMTLAMVQAPGRKSAALRQDGRVATGRIEMEEAA